ncbi:uncharacterized protein LOC129581434 [Paramacrobiotus metropolitanus]|uniref:uncharacterized protein LOC129581434 n=1 Tax=Paramacrobiotus metropolitanus TaxID=2943436 RepID=UPI0024463E67|nr:uncharacterized protein LOC129581434 [Paramacrobiotus metropolitanus]
MFNSSIWRYGTVDVKGDNGLVRHGIITDLIDPRLFIVNFDYPDHHTEEVSFSQLLLCRDGSHNIAVGNRVQTLYRTSPNQPWCWHPSTLLAYSFAGRYAIVEIDCDCGDIDGAVLREVVAEECVQAQGEWSALPWTEDCVRHWKHCVALPPPNPEVTALAKRNEFWQLWNRKTRTIGVQLDDCRLIYIAPMQDGAAVEDAECATLLQRLYGEIASRNSIQIASSALTDADTSPAACMNSYLSREILCTIFAFLSIDEQVKFRTVSKSWDALLMSHPVSSRIDIELADYRLEAHNYRLAVMLHRMVNKSTKTLFITGRSALRLRIGCRNHCLMNTIADVLQAKNIRIPLIVISEVSGRYLTFQGDSLSSWFRRTHWKCICLQLLLEKIGSGFWRAELSKHFESDYAVSCGSKWIRVGFGHDLAGGK